jgi:hypothetical protein
VNALRQRRRQSPIASPTAQLYAVPQTVAVEVPAIQSYKYMMVNGRVVLVDPSTSEVVAELAN